MSLSQKSRTAIYTGLTEFVDEQAVEEMLSFFPSRDLDEPVTKEFLRAELAGIRTEMAELRADTRDELAALRADTHDGLAALRADTHDGLAALRADTHDGLADGRVGLAELRAEMHRGFRRMTVAIYGSMTATVGVVIAVATITG